MHSLDKNYIKYVYIIIEIYIYLGTAKNIFIFLKEKIKECENSGPRDTERYKEYGFGLTFGS